MIELDQSDILGFEDIYERKDRIIDKAKVLLTNEKLPIAANGYRRMFDEMNAQGIMEFVYKEDVILGKSYLYRSLLGYQWLIENSVNPEYQITQRYLSYNEYKSMCYSVICGEKNIRTMIAQRAGLNVEYEKITTLSEILLIKAMKYLILDDKENAREILDTIDNSKTARGMKKICAAHGVAFRGLLEENEEMLAEGIKKMLKLHSEIMKRECNGLEWYFPYESITLILLAQERGMHVDMEDPYLPKEYFMDTDIAYDEITLW